MELDEHVRQGLHRLHRPHAFEGQREEEHLREHREQDDRDTSVTRLLSVTLLPFLVRAIVLAAHTRGYECVGIRDGFNGLLAPEQRSELRVADDAAADRVLASIRAEVERKVRDGQVVQRRAPIYDKGQDGHYNLISALHKSVRGSDPDAALYYLARMLDAGGTILGKVHCEYFCFSGGSHTSSPGPVHNPRKYGYSAGGSSRSRTIAS